MLSIDRVRTTTLSLLGLGAGSSLSGSFRAAGLRATGKEPSPSRTGPDRSDHDEEADPSPSRPNPFSAVDPAFVAVESALREAGYLDS